MFLQPNADGIEIPPAFNESATISYSKKKDTRIKGPWSFPT